MKRKKTKGDEERRNESERKDKVTAAEKRQRRARQHTKQDACN